MSINSLPKINQKEYLEKYLSGDKVKKKKKAKKHKKSSSYTNVKIIDDDINHLDTVWQIDEELLLTGDDAPQIVGEYIEEKPNENKVQKWRNIGIKEEPQDDRVVSSQNESDLWGEKSREVKVVQQSASGNNRVAKSPNYSPLRRKEHHGIRVSSQSSPRRGTVSPPRKKTKKGKRDKSPNRRKQTDESYYRHKIKCEPQSPGIESRSPDQSPPRRKHGREDSFNSSSQRRQRSPFKKTSHIKGKSPCQSPPRRKGNKDRSPCIYRKNSPDLTPPRKSKNSDQSPLRRRRNSDESPPRRRQNSGRLTSTKDRNRSIDVPPPKKRHSPHKFPSRKDKNRSPDQSPSCRRSSADLSPLRKSRNHSPDQSPPRRRRSPNQILPYKGENRSNDQSPPRRRQNSDHSPSQRNKNSHKIKERDSPPRSSGSSPSTRIKRENLESYSSDPPKYSRWKRQESENSLSPPPTHKPKPGKTLEGKKAGLQDAQALQKESLERRKQEDLLFEKMSSDISGRHAEVQVRSTGRKSRKIREADEEDPEERRRKEEHEEKKKQLYDRWGRGLKQIEDHKNRLLEQEYESSKPLARYSNDEDLERHLKEKERAEDPMLEYMRQKRKEKEKESGKPQIPRYEGPFPENRFGIRPGYRWDGVDRSNGYEKKYFSVQNENRARQEEAYKYSVEDM